MGFQPQKDPLLQAAQRLVLLSVRALVVLMTLVIFWGLAIARKVIVLDYKEPSPEYVWATAGVVLAMSLGYWLVGRQGERTVAVAESRRPKTAASGDDE